MAGMFITGSAGQVGRELVDAAAAAGHAVVASDRAHLDITDAEAVVAAVRECRPDLVVNLAAYTAVDKAETEPDLALAINAHGAGNVARAAAKARCPIIHLSTDYVFDGRGKRPYLEDDAIAPIGVYGRSKAAGETEVRAANPHHAIVRTSWIFGVHGNNFVKTMLRVGSARDSLQVVDDQIGCPTPAADIARAILAIGAKLTAGTGTAGTLHYCGDEATNWYEFAGVIFAAAAHGMHPPKLTPIATADYPTAAERPAYSVLDCTRLRDDYGIAPPSWRRSLAEVVGAILGPASEDKENAR